MQMQALKWFDLTVKLKILLNYVEWMSNLTCHSVINSPLFIDYGRHKFQQQYWCQMLKPSSQSVSFTT